MSAARCDFALEISIVLNNQSSKFSEPSGSTGMHTFTRPHDLHVTWPHTMRYTCHINMTSCVMNMLWHA